MNRLLTTLALGLIVATSLHAGKVRLVWDTNPKEELVQSYVLYEHLDRVFVRLKTVFTNSATLTNVSVGPHCYVVTASNFWGESIFSNEACTLIHTAPTIPTSIEIATNGVAVTGLVTSDKTVLMYSTDKTNWETHAVVYTFDRRIESVTYNIGITNDIGFWKILR